MYKLFNGTFTSVLDAFSREALVHKLETFFPQHIPTLDFEHSDVVEAFHGKCLLTQPHFPKRTPRMRAGQYVDAIGRASPVKHV